MTPHKHDSSEIADEKVVQTLYVFAGAASKPGAPVEEVKETLRDSALDSQVARAIVHDLARLRGQVEQRRRLARRYYAISAGVIGVGMLAALAFQMMPVPFTLSIAVVTLAAFMALGTFAHARMLVVRQ